MTARTPSILGKISVLGVTIVASILCPARAVPQTFNDILESEAFNKVARDSANSHHHSGRKADKNARPVTNYDLLWNSPKPGRLLLEWISAGSTGLVLEQTSSYEREEFVWGFAALRDREHAQVELVVQVPRPEFITMAEYGTLAGFNKFKPPMLDVVADQVVPIQGLNGTYYRHKDGACSLLFNIDKQGIVNLRTQRCSDAAIMMKAAKALNFARLSQKLNS